MHQLADIQGTKANISVHCRPRIGWEILQLGHFRDSGNDRAKEDHEEEEGDHEEAKGDHGEGKGDHEEEEW